MEGGNNKVAIWIVVIVIVIAGIWLIARGKSDTNDTAQEATGEPIKIGFIGPLSGDVANIGANAKAAVEIAVEEVNSSGGINGRPLEVIYEDGACAGAPAANAVNKLVNTDKVPVIIGAGCSGETLSAAPIAEQNKTVMISYCSTSPLVTTAGDYIFRSVPSDSFQGDRAAKLLFTELNKKKVAIIYTNSDWGVGIRDAFTNAYKALGGEVVLSEGFEQTSKDVRTQLAKVKSSKAEALYFLGYPEDSTAGIRQAKELGIKLQLVGADGWDDPKMWSDLGALGDGAMFTLAGSNDLPGFKSKMAEKVGSDNLIYCSNYAYDNTHVIANVMREVGTDSTAIKNALYKVNYTGGAGVDPLQFDLNGDPVTANYVVKMVKDGVATVKTD